MAIAPLLGWVPANAQDAELQIVGTAKAGETISVEWTGPDQPGDFLALAWPDGKTAEFVSYHRASLGSPAVLHVSDAGTYEIRYVSAANLTIIERMLVIVGAVTQDEAADQTGQATAEPVMDHTDARPEGSLFSLAAVDIGSIFRVMWDFQIGSGARLDIVDLTTQAVVTSNPIDHRETVSVSAPATAGLFEIRLVGSDGEVRAQRQLEVR